MIVVCKNTNCKQYYQLKDGNHCPVEDECPQYSNNRKKSNNERLMCKDCEYCKAVPDEVGYSYHWECFHENNMRENPIRGRGRKHLLFIDTRTCDCMI